MSLLQPGHVARTLRALPLPHALMRMEATTAAATSMHIACLLVAHSPPTLPPPAQLRVGVEVHSSQIHAACSMRSHRMIHDEMYPGTNMGHE